MPSVPDQTFLLDLNVAGPLAVLPKRLLSVNFKLPSPLLRALGPSEQAGPGIWSEWLAEWGWTWAVAQESSDPLVPLIDIWFLRSTWPKDFDARVLSLAVALKLLVDGKLISNDRTCIVDLKKAWEKISSLKRNELGNILSLALLRADLTVFDFASVAPSWPADVGLVVAERRALRDMREPDPIWLKYGYFLLGEVFGMIRQMGSSLEECTEIYEVLSKGKELTETFEMAFWWEASYCLTERHDYDGAETAQSKVEAIVNKLKDISGLIDPMWHHQQGRLYYYAGNYEAALAEYLREYKVFGNDLKVSAMLCREIANVLSDLACFEASENFANKSVDIARAQGQRNELYKSLGRMGELAIKRGDLTSAQDYLKQSLLIQEALNEKNLTTAQTLTYLGHVANLSGDITAAIDFYDRATNRDKDKSSLPYTTMGRFATEAKLGNEDALEVLWNINREKVFEWAQHKTHVLPASVCVLAASFYIPQARDKCLWMAQRLMENCYPVEAAYMLSEYGELNHSKIYADILGVLKKWQKTLSTFPQELVQITGPLNGPSRIASEIQNGILHQEKFFQYASYPMTLCRALK